MRAAGVQSQEAGHLAGQPGHSPTHPCGRAACRVGGKPVILLGRDGGKPVILLGRVGGKPVILLGRVGGKPVILLGSQPTLPPNPVDELRAALEESRSFC